NHPSSKRCQARSCSRSVGPSRATERRRRRTASGPWIQHNWLNRDRTAQRPELTPSTTSTSTTGTDTDSPYRGTPEDQSSRRYRPASPRESGSNTPSTRRGHHETGRCHVAKWSVGTTAALTPRGCSSSSNHRATVVLPEPEGPSTAMSRTEPRRGGAARTLSTTVGTSSQRTTTGQRAAEGEFVGELQIAPHRQSRSQPCGAQPGEIPQDTHQVRGRGLALGVGVGGDDDLTDLVGSDPAQQLTHPQLFRADPGQGVQRTAQHMVTAPE